MMDGSSFVSFMSTVAPRTILFIQHPVLGYNGVSMIPAFGGVQFNRRVYNYRTMEFALERPP